MQGIKNLTHGPINRQLFNLAMPIMATSFIQMAYSLTDMAWVGRLGSEAVAAIPATRNDIREYSAKNRTVIPKANSFLETSQRELPSIGTVSVTNKRNIQMVW